MAEASFRRVCVVGLGYVGLPTAASIAAGGQEDELAAAVTRLADDSELSRRLGAAGREYVIERYDRDRLADRYLGIIKRVADRDLD